MLRYYEQKGRKIYFAVMLSFIIVFSFAFYAGKFYTLQTTNTTSSVIMNIDEAQNKEKQIAGQFAYVEGNVEMRTHAQDGWRSVQKSVVIKTDHEVRTLVGARAIITFEDGSSVRLNENTHIVVKNTDADIKINMVQGEIFNIVAKDVQREYVVATDICRVVARGTEFGVTQEENGVSVMVMESAVAITTNKDDVIGEVVAGDKASITQERVTKNKITSADLKDDFVVWNTETKKDVTERSVEAETKNDSQKMDNVAERKITVHGKKTSEGIFLTWETTNMHATHGFKIVKSTDANPVYPGDEYKYLTESDVRNFLWKIDTDKTYHFRVCAYDGSGACLIYSNDISLEAPSAKDEGVDDEYASSISLSAKEDDGNVKLSWKISGGDAPKGFKIVKSKEQSPVYPGDDYQYISDEDERSYTWKGFSKDKTYHFRVCVYKGGSCGAYSNDVKVSF